jgi:multimeric flavodoxin WrbA
MTAKKVVLLCGSPRPEGNTRQVLDECASVIRAAGVEAEVIPLGSMQIRSCIACGQCREQGICLLDDGLNEVIEQVRGAEGLIVGAPVYFGTARADMMAALQRIGKVSRANGNFLSWKVGGPIAVARRGGHTSSLQEMLMFFLINDMIVVGSTYWNMVFGGNQGDVWKDEEGIVGVRRFAENVAELVKRI